MIFNYYKILRRLYVQNNLLAKILLKILNKPYEYSLKIIYGAHVPYNANIHFICKFPHSFYGVFISGNAVIEKNCTVFHHVTIGAGLPKTEKAPIIKESTFIGANCSIFGDVIIGKNVNIGGGTVVAKNIHDNCTVISASNRIILHEN
jgi:serine O-acetyltransferase